MNNIQLSSDGQKIKAPSGQRITSKQLRMGETYLREDCWRYRTIIRLIDKDVVYVDTAGPGQCSRTHFVKLCPTITTEEERRFLKVEEHNRQWLNLPLNQDQKQKAMLIGSFVRNALEDFHVKHIPDQYMKELNQTVRNAVATALHVIDNAPLNEVAERTFMWTAKAIPHYWEEPELESDYQVALEKLDKRLG